MGPVFLAWLRARTWSIALGILWAVLTGVVTSLYGLSSECIVYLFVLWLAAALVFAGADWFRFFRKHRTLEKLAGELLTTTENLPQGDTLLEGDYLSLLRLLSGELTRQEAAHQREMSQTVAYYTCWVHQIKTPLAASSLLLQTLPGEIRGPLEGELLKISQYADMALQYLRLDSDSHDLTLTRCQVDDIIRQVVRKFARLFILKKIRLEFRETGWTVLSDEKWLAFLLEQLLSNSLKYTPAGGLVCIYGEDPLTLVLADTGIGIAPKDLPRVFEQGFTGSNGRLEKRATGLGLYLSRRASNLLGHTLTLSSQQGEGTQVRIGLSRRELPIE